MLRRRKFTRKYVDTVLHDKDINELTKGTSIATFFKVLSLPLGLATSLIISRWYGADAVGLYGITLAITGIASRIAMGGINNAMPRLLGESRAQSHNNEKPIYRTSLRLFFFGGVLFSLLLYITSPWISTAVFDDSRLIFALQVSALFIFPIMWYQLNYAFLNAAKKIFHGEQVTKFLVPFIMLLIVSISYWIRPTYYIPIWAYLLSTLTGLLISLYMLWKYKYTSIRGTLFSIKKIISISAPMLITGMAAMIINYTDVLMLGRLTDTMTVGIYQVVYSLAVLIPLGLQLIAVILKPKIAELYRGKHMRKLQQILSLSIRAISLIAIVIFFLYQFFGSFILGLRGSEFMNGFSALRILSVGTLINALCGTNTVYMNATGKEAIVQKIFIGAAIINIALNYILIPVLGMNGAAIATGFSLVIWNIIVSLYVWKIDKIKTFINT